MNADEVIESYVTDVAARLPRRQRNDVAFELRALLNEELQARTEVSGRGADAAAAIAMLRDFGDPADVAARYRPTLTIIDPADGYRFLRASVIGVAIIWCAGLLAQLGQPLESTSDVLRALGQWWTGAVIPSLWWPGVLVVGYGTAAWSRRRRPQAAAWTPRAADALAGGRVAMAMGLVGMVLGLYVLLDPRWVLDVFWQGRAAPVAYQALTYTDAFLRLQGPVLLALILLNIPLYMVVLVSGRRSILVQRMETGLGLLTCAAMLWAVADGPILMASNSDQMAKVLMVLIVAAMLITMGIKLHRNVRPMPDRQVHVPR